MSILIRQMKEADRDSVIDMMRRFYASNAVATNGSEEIFKSDVDACVSDNPYLEGYVFDNNDDIVGYGMLAKSFSTEYGKACIWIEDIYIEEEFRGCGLGSEFFDFIEKKYDNCIFRLEVEEENERALRVYKKNGFEFMPYKEMKK